MHDVSEERGVDRLHALDEAVALHQKGKLTAAEELYLSALKAAPGNFDVQHLFGLLRFQQGRMTEALSLVELALSKDASSAVAWSNHALILYALERHEEALKSCDRALAIKPDLAEAFNNRGNALASLKRHEEALASYDRALVFRSDCAEVLCNRGNTLRALERYRDALDSYDQVLVIAPKLFEALYGRGRALQALLRHEEALGSYDQALVRKEGHGETLYRRGNVLRALNRPAEALASYDMALATKPDFLEALYNRGNSLMQLNRYQEALDSYDKVLAIQTDHDGALNARGEVLRSLNRPQEALDCYDRALAIRPDFPGCLNNRGNALLALDRHTEALESYDRALILMPEYADAHYNRGIVLRNLERHAEAIASFEKALAIKPDHPWAFDALAHAALVICDWTRAAQLRPQIESHVTQEKSIITPFTMLSYSGNPSLLLQCNANYIRATTEGFPVYTGAICRHDRIKVAYFSPDFRDHAVSFLIAELIELHDRSRFEVYGISFGRDDGSGMRARLAAAFDHFLDVRSKNDTEIAELIRGLEIDIAVDLTGYTKGGRPGIFARRAAPIQVNYLGFPGTMGANFIDYIIADRIVLPFDQQPFYSERIVHLPDSFQVNDSKRRIAEHTSSRSDLKLPDEGFVFCCFNNSYKIAPDIFDIWMRLLQQTDGSVLWLLGSNAGLRRNLSYETERRGVSASRLIFAPPLPLDKHLARQRRADLFLDTLPCGAGSSASDALRAGLPLLTCYGESFAGRAAASLLHAVGLPELIANNLTDYEVLALRLTKDPALLSSLRDRLKQDAPKSPLFDADRFRRHIESAYREMWRRWQHGESPQSFAVQTER